MKITRTGFLVCLLLMVSACGINDAPGTKTAGAPDNADETGGRLMRATYSPLHFKPAIDTATDEQCLACHKEVLEEKPRVASPAGARAADSLAWYQLTSTYSGDQDSFHRRHMVTPLARQLMNLKCNTCHQGHDPREEAPGSSATSAAQSDTGFTLRKQVNPETTCLKCHGRMPVEVMGLPGLWPDAKDLFRNDCLACHVNTRTNRHKVSYLNAKAIEDAAIAGRDAGTAGDVCYGCHGGRAWYRIAYPYARNAWPDMPEGTPDWARTRPTQSESRFVKPEQKP